MSTKKPVQKILRELHKIHSIIYRDSNALQGIDLDNFMKEDYDNTAFNVFDEGIAPTQCNTSENRRILLRNVPFKLKSEAIKRLLEQFGSVVDFSIPNNQDSFNNKKGFRCVFAEFELFR